jgi:hypothetical protein
MNGMLSTTNVAQQTDADRDILAWRAANPEEAAQPTPAPDDILTDSTDDGFDGIDFEFDGIDTPEMIETEAEGILIDGELDILDQGANAVADVPMSFEDIMNGGNEEQILGWANDNSRTPIGRALLNKYEAYSYQGHHGTLDKGYTFDGDYSAARDLIHTNTDQFHNGDRTSDEFKNSTDILGTRSFVDTYVDGIGQEGSWNVQEYFNVIHNMYINNPDEYKKWAAETPEMAIRFHALAATDSFAAQDEGSFDHQRQADMIGHGLRVNAGWGDEQKRDGQVWATNYGGEVSKDVNNPESGGDFWKIGTPQKVTDGIGNYVKDNPVESIAIVGAIAFAGPLAGWASAAAGGGVAGAAAGGAAAGALTGGVSSFAAGGDFGDVLEGALLGGTMGAVTGGISEYISPAQMGPAFEGIPDFNDPAFGIEDAFQFADASGMPPTWVQQIEAGIGIGDDFSWGDAMATVADSVTDMSALVPEGAVSSSQNGMGGYGMGLGAASALVGNGTGARGEGNLFDLTKISPAATAILGPMIDNTEGLIDENIS